MFFAVVTIAVTIGRNMGEQDHFHYPLGLYVDVKYFMIGPGQHPSVAELSLL